MRTILIVDGEQPTRELLVAYLNGQARRVLEAASAHEALRLAAAEHPDLVVVDLDLEGRTGLQTMRRLKQQVPDEYLPVIVVAPFGDPATRVEAWEAGADDVLARPVHRQELLQRIESLLGLRREREAMTRANAELRRLQQYKDALDEVIVHDLKNPLAALSANLDFLMDGVSSDARPDLREAVDDSLGALHRLQRMIASINDAAALEARALQLRLERVLLTPLLAKLRSLHRQAASERRVALEVECPEELCFTADEDRLGRAVENIIEPLLKRTPRAGRLTVRATAHEGRVRIALISTGPPIPPELRPLLFERFGQVFLPDNQPRFGSGLGLYFCRLAVEAHGGRVGLGDDAPLCFVIELPVAPPANR